MKKPRAYITKQQAVDRLLKTGTVITANLPNGDYCFLNSHSHNKEYVRVTCSLPMSVVKRHSLPSGMVSTLDEYLMIFHNKGKEINYEKAS